MHRYMNCSLSPINCIIAVLVQLQVLLLYYHSSITFLNAGASSTLKNPVNSYTPNESLNLSSSTQFQNEYQYRQSSIKTSTDRNKPSTTLPLTDGILDHLTSDLGNLGTSDYSYQDHRSMTNVPVCDGRLKLNGTRGFITDGPGHYDTNLQCTWIIDSGRSNAVIRIRFHQFNTECNYDFLYIFDGDSIYSPLVATLTGDMIDFSNTFIGNDVPDLISEDESYSVKSATETLTDPTTTDKSIQVKNAPIKKSRSAESRSFELKTTSGKAFIYFHSDTALRMPGFYMTYSIDSCPLDCSNRGECDYTDLTCRCDFGFFGDGCQHILCPNNCTSAQHGICDKTKSCICHEGFSGQDCSKKVELQYWETISNQEKIMSSRAFHQSCILDDTMWILGGKTQILGNAHISIPTHQRTLIVLAFDLRERRRTDINIEGLTGIDHLAELSGHSIATYGSNIFIYGGKAMNGTILNVLTVFDAKTYTLSTIANGKKLKNQDEEFVAPLAVTGHSSNIIDGYMYIFMGYNPTFGYLNFVQKFNLANNSWSIVQNRGSSIVGCIGHSSTFDPIGRLIYIYGGHNARQSNKLYSFDPRTEIWTYLHAGPSPRYFHSANILNNQLIIIGGNTYNTSHRSDQCFQPNYLTYDLNCSEHVTNGQESRSGGCGRKCWSSIDEIGTSVSKRYGHSVVARDEKELILFGGFNGVLLNDIRLMNIRSCTGLTNEQDCNRTKIGLNCRWISENSTCSDYISRGMTLSQIEVSSYNCTTSEVRSLQNSCESRKTCTDCLNTNLGCVWCGISQCQYNKCKSIFSQPILDPDTCHKEGLIFPVPAVKNATHREFEAGLLNQEQDNHPDCKVDNCYLCQSRHHCSWQSEVCVYNPPSAFSSLPSGFVPSDENLDSSSAEASKQLINSTTSKFMHKLDPFNKSFLAALTNSLLNTSPYASCDIPCFMRRSCNECTTTKCIWCSTKEQCIDSSAYFAYHSMGQCLHYAAHMAKCPGASCSDIETCHKCLTNPKCGWLNDISNTGKGRCIEGNTSMPTIEPNSNASDMGKFLLTNVGDINNNASSINSNTSSISGSSGAITFTSLISTNVPNWYYYTCPLCQCNGHSFCKPNSNICIQPCQDYTEGPHCDRCSSGYFGDPVNGGLCKPCRCNGHAESCNHETGKCYCSVKGIIGHNCNRCDDKNYYIGDPSSSNGSCYYNLTTDYQYIFNMSKMEDHFYSEINFINIPLRKESDADFSIACSRLALVNITSGTSYKDRRPIHTGVECGSFLLRFPHDRHNFSESNYSLFVHVYKFNTPFILQIAFSQQRTLYLPQFFFTFLSCFLFFFALAGLAWKLKHEYDLYIRRQRQFIEMEQMASRPFSTILLEMSNSGGNQKLTDPISDKQSILEPTPISFEPCFGGNVGVLSVFVQFPGRPNLAVGSALVSLNEDATTTCEDDNEVGKRSSSKQQEHTSTKNLR